MHQVPERPTQAQFWSHPGAGFWDATGNVQASVTKMFSRVEVVIVGVGRLRVPTGRMWHGWATPLGAGCAQTPAMKVRL